MGFLNLTLESPSLSPLPVNFLKGRPKITLRYKLLLTRSTNCSVDNRDL